MDVLLNEQMYKLLNDSDTADNDDMTATPFDIWMHSIISNDLKASEYNTL
jgi:hypothetical protein